jgi:hypothetical protein
MLLQRFQSPSDRLEMTLETSSTWAASRIRPDRWAEVPIIADFGGAYTLGKDGADAEFGLEFSPVSPVDVVGDSGGARREVVSAIRESDIVKSSDCARFCRERGLEMCSLSLASKSESDPRLDASSACFVRWGIPDP